MDVSGDPSFPDGYWERFRDVVKASNPSALTISETWQKDTSLLRMLRGDRLDTTMNYRLRDAVLGLLTPGAFDSKGFADSQAQAEHVRVRGPARVDPGGLRRPGVLLAHEPPRQPRHRAAALDAHAGRGVAREGLDPANVAVGKRRVRVASLIQFTVPGAPTVFYGTRSASRRRRPGRPPAGPVARPRGLAGYRAARALPGAVRPADGAPLARRRRLRILLADDAAETVAYGRKTASEGVDRRREPGRRRAHAQDPARRLPPSGACTVRYSVGAVDGAAVAGGVLELTLEPFGAAVCVTPAGVDLAAPDAPAGLAVAGESSGQVSLTWNAVSGAASYNVYRSPLSGGGWVKANASPVTGTSFTDTGLVNARTTYYVVRALDAAGNESGPSNEVTGLPHLTIGWANLQWPPTLTHTISAVDRTDNVYGQVWIDGVTNEAGPDREPARPARLRPRRHRSGGERRVDVDRGVVQRGRGEQRRVRRKPPPEAVGSFDYAYRYDDRRPRLVYADLDGIGNGYSAAQAGSLTVVSSGDTTAPARPGGLHVLSASPAGVALAWDAVTGDPTLHGYEVRPLLIARRAVHDP